MEYILRQDDTKIIPYFEYHNFENTIYKCSRKIGQYDEITDENEIEYLNRMALRKDNCIKVDKWENEMDEEREKKIKAEFLESEMKMKWNKLNLFIIEQIEQ